MELVDATVKSANIILYLFHLYFNRQDPFSPKMKWNAPGTRKIARLNDRQLSLVEHVRKGRKEERKRVCVLSRDEAS